MYNTLVKILLEEELEEFQQAILAELGQVKPGLDGQE